MPALRAAFREDPDIIVVGEMRDRETIRLTIEAALTGHLVPGTLHTVSAPKTVERILEVFPASEQSLVRNSLSTSLRLVPQTLFRRVDERGRIAAFEILVGTPAVANVIREGTTYQLVSMIRTGKKHGMRMMDDSIQELLAKKLISAEEAYEKAAEKGRSAGLLAGPPTS